MVAGCGWLWLGASGWLGGCRICPRGTLVWLVAGWQSARLPSQRPSAFPVLSVCLSLSLSLSLPASCRLVLLTCRYDIRAIRLIYYIIVYIVLYSYRLHVALAEVLRVVATITV